MTESSYQLQAYVLRLSELQIQFADKLPSRADSNKLRLKVLFALARCGVDHFDVREEIKSILKDAYIRERKLNLLYTTLDVSDGVVSSADCFFVKAREDQRGDLEVLLKINCSYGNEEIDLGMLDKLGEGLVNLRAGHADREELLRKVLEWETELVDVYKQSLRYLSNDDETRKLINRILTVKLGHRRSLMEKLEMFVVSKD